LSFFALRSGIPKRYCCSPKIKTFGPPDILASQNFLVRPKVWAGYAADNNCRKRLLLETVWNAVKVIRTWSVCRNVMHMSGCQQNQWVKQAVAYIVTSVQGVLHNVSITQGIVCIYNIKITSVFFKKKIH